MFESDAECAEIDGVAVTAYDSDTEALGVTEACRLPEDSWAETNAEEDSE